MLCGCRFEYAIDALLDRFFKFNEVTELAGDEWRDEWECDERVAHDKALPVCDNDWDFKLLRQQFCNSDFEPAGPYEPHDAEDDSEDETGSEDATDSEDEDDSKDDAESDSEDDGGSSFFSSRLRDGQVCWVRVGADDMDDSEEGSVEQAWDEDEFYVCC